jgi:hypothetical protein
MKKRISVLSIGLAVLLLAFAMTAGLFASAADDYKVIKNAVKGPETAKAGQKGVQWFKILVVGKDGDDEKVNITLPISLVEIMIKACPDKRFHVEHGCEIDIQKVWSDLKAAGPLALVEVVDHGETVKIWLE